jgi:hypothetical protein
METWLCSNNLMAVRSVKQIDLRCRKYVATRWVTANTAATLAQCYHVPTSAAASVTVTSNRIAKQWSRVIWMHAAPKWRLGLLTAHNKLHCNYRKAQISRLALFVVQNCKSVMKLGVGQISCNNVS